MADTISLPPTISSVYSMSDLPRTWDLVAQKLKSGKFKFRDESARHVLEPALKEMIGNPEGLRVLDAGCGDGWLSGDLSAAGATVTAIDFSTSMLDLAKSRTSGHNVLFLLEDLTEKPSVCGQFDLIVCNMVLMGVPAISKAFQALQRRLKPSGRLVCSILHPCFLSLNELPGLGWKARRDPWHPQGADTPFAVDQYFSRSPIVVSTDACELHHFHRPLEDYFQAIERAGLSLTKLREPKGTPPSPTARLAYYLVFEASAPA